MGKSLTPTILKYIKWQMKYYQTKTLNDRVIKVKKRDLNVVQITLFPTVISK